MTFNREKLPFLGNPDMDPLYELSPEERKKLYDLCKPKFNPIKGRVIIVGTAGSFSSDELKNLEELFYGQTWNNQSPHQ